VPESIIPSADALGQYARRHFPDASPSHGPFAWEFPGRLLLRRRRWSRSLPTWRLTGGKETQPCQACQRTRSIINGTCAPILCAAATLWSACTVSGQSGGPPL